MGRDLPSLHSSRVYHVPNLPLLHWKPPEKREPSARERKREKKQEERNEMETANKEANDRRDAEAEAKAEAGAFPELRAEVVVEPVDSLTPLGSAVKNAFSK